MNQTTKDLIDGVLSQTSCTKVEFAPDKAGASLHPYEVNKHEFLNHPAGTLMVIERRTEQKVRGDMRSITENYVCAKCEQGTWTEHLGELGKELCILDFTARDAIAPYLISKKDLLESITILLQLYRQRATYAAVGEYVGLPAQSIGRVLGQKTTKNSWIVAKKTGRPSGYVEIQIHPELRESTKPLLDTRAKLEDFLNNPNPQNRSGD
jgi:hypothetical protein